MSAVAIPAPNSRSLRIFAFDPSVSAQYSTAGIGEITIAVRWEKDLKPGPIGEYLAVIDADPASQAFYRHVDLNDRHLLAQSGLAPAETNPLFHQQMVYAVAMTTIGHFEQALGRVALWSSDGARSEKKEFVRQLRIYPHALRERNAYYSPHKKALLFGYFPVSIKDANNTPGTVVFSCLSHDIIAHETTHALLDGVHPRFSELVNADVFAFHEAFADIVALFQHFTYPGILRDQVGRARGDLAAETMLGQLAQQFGRSSGRSAALRDAIGGFDEKEKQWKPHVPDPRILERTTEPHERGSVLVAAIFGAFLKVYRARTLDLYRIASEGTGVLRAGDILPDLTNRLADEASRTAQYLLQLCIRAIDYCPPVGITFGDYLRALITADVDFNADDPYGYRIALVDSFRQWGIHPEGMRSMSIEALLWPSGRALHPMVGVDADAEYLKSLFENLQEVASVFEQSVTDRVRSRGQVDFQQWGLESDRYETWEGILANSAGLWNWLVRGNGRPFAEMLGLIMDDVGVPGTVFRSSASGQQAPAVEVHSVRRALRRTQRGEIVKDLVIEVTQRRRGYLDAAIQREQDGLAPSATFRKEDFIYRAGSTALVDPDTMQIRRVIRTPGTIVDDGQLDRVRVFLRNGGGPMNAYFTMRAGMGLDGPFALLHRDGKE